jgi:hypothetical protein
MYLSENCSDTIMIVKLRGAVHLDLGHYDSSTPAGPRMDSIGLGEHQHLFPIVHSLQHLQPTRAQTFTVLGCQVTTLQVNVYIHRGQIIA